MIITISGEVGAGKNFLGKKLADRLNLCYESVGEKFKKLAKERSMTVTEILNYLEKNPEEEKKIDEEQNKVEDNCVLDSRLGFHFVNTDLKIYLTASLDERARRIAERDNQSVEQTKEMIKEREKTETGRYKRIYNVEIRNMDNYNLVIDTEKFETDKILNAILYLIKK